MMHWSGYMVGVLKNPWPFEQAQAFMVCANTLLQ
jgi:hypothetical protein